MYSSIRAFKYENGEMESSTIHLIEETPLELVVNQRPPTLLMFTPVMIQELVTGFVFTEGFIESLEDIEENEITEETGEGGERVIKARVTVRNDKLREPVANEARISYSSCGVCGKESYEELGQNLERVKSKQRFSMEVLLGIRDKILESQPLYVKTGGAHGAFLFDSEGNPLLSGEDMGRHNALDKVIGASLINKLNMGDKILVTSGRASLEMILKTARAGLSVFVAISRPTSRAVEAARFYNITLVDLARNSNRIYTHARRISEF
jgi:FdhD protein